MINKLQQIQQKCKCSINLSINDYRNYYQSIRKGIDEINRMLEDWGDDLLSEEMINKMIEHEMIVELCFYPDTPVGSYNIFHYDIEQALEEALRILNNN